MALPTITGVARLVVLGQTANLQPFVNVHHIGTIGAGAWANTDTGNAIDHIETLYSSAGFGGGNHGWAYYAADPAVVTEINCTPLDGSTATTTRVENILSTPAQDSLPGECALICSHVTPLRGRSYRGRTYWPSPYEGLSNADGALDGTLAGSISLTWQAFRAALAGDTLEHVIASYVHSTASAVELTIARRYFGHQDRRRR